MQTNLNNNFQKSEISARIEQLISVLGIKNNVFAEQLNVSKGRLSNIVTGRNKPDSDFLSKIATVFKDDVNITWLLTGEGEPLLRNMNILRNQNKGPVLNAGNDTGSISKSEILLPDLRQNQLSEGQIQYQSMSSIGDKMEIEHLKVELQKRDVLLEDKEERIKELKDHIKTLNNRITDMEERIEEFKSAKFSTKVPVLETTQP